MEKPELKPNKSKTPVPQKAKYNPILRYSGMAFQMLSVIVCLTLAGKYLDSWMGNKFPGFTVGFVIFSVFASVYLSIRDFLKD